MFGVDRPVLIVRQILAKSGLVAVHAEVGCDSIRPSPVARDLLSRRQILRKAKKSQVGIELGQATDLGKNLQISRLRLRLRR